MQRRQVLKLLGANAAGRSFARCAAQFAAQFSILPAAALPVQTWGYLGKTSPEHWSELSPEFQLCQAGQQQAPIDLLETAAAEPATLEIHYQPAPLRITNTAHTIQISYEPGSFITFQGKTFQLLQFHFHHPSEHRLMGKSFDLELHLVHRSPAGKLAVIGVLVQAGKHNAVLQPLWDIMPVQPETIETQTPINAAHLLPPEDGQTASRKFYEYRGSLTTPPCTEDVLWFVMAQPIEASAQQIQQFAALFPLNARPIQPRGDRIIKRSI